MELRIVTGSLTCTAISLVLWIPSYRGLDDTCHITVWRHREFGMSEPRGMDQRWTEPRPGTTGILSFVSLPICFVSLWWPPPTIPASIILSLFLKICVKFLNREKRSQTLSRSIKKCTEKRQQNKSDHNLNSRSVWLPPSDLDRSCLNVGNF